MRATAPALLGRPAQVRRWYDCRTRGSRNVFLVDAVGKRRLYYAWADAADHDAGWLLDAWGCPAGSANQGATGHDGMRLGQRPQPAAIGDHVPNVGALVEYPAQHDIQ